MRLIKVTTPPVAQGLPDGVVWINPRLVASVSAAQIELNDATTGARIGMQGPVGLIQTNMSVDDVVALINGAG